MGFLWTNKKIALQCALALQNAPLLLQFSRSLVTYVRTHCPCSQDSRAEARGTTAARRVRRTRPGKNAAYCTGDAGLSFAQLNVAGLLPGWLAGTVGILFPAVASCSLLTCSCLFVSASGSFWPPKATAYCQTLSFSASFYKIYWGKNHLKST
jgi:hypothetical protein